MKCLVFALVFIASAAHADIPSPPSTKVSQLKDANLETIYDLAGGTETQIGSSGESGRTVTVTRKIARYQTTNKEQYDIAVVCSRTSRAHFGSAQSRSYVCHEIRATNMKLPASEADLLKLIPGGAGGGAANAAAKQGT